MSDEPTTPDQPAEPQPEPEQPTDLGGQWQEANDHPETNVGAKLTSDESVIGEAGSRAHNERIGSQQ